MIRIVAFWVVACVRELVGWVLVGCCIKTVFEKGSAILKVVPLPISDSTASPPLCPRTIPKTAAKPSPLPVVLVVKNGSKILANVDEDIPSPLSAKEMMRYSPSIRDCPVNFEKAFSL